MKIFLILCLFSSALVTACGSSKSTETKNFEGRGPYRFLPREAQPTKDSEVFTANIVLMIDDGQYTYAELKTYQDQLIKDISSDVDVYKSRLNRDCATYAKLLAIASAELEALTAHKQDLLNLHLKDSDKLNGMDFQVGTSVVSGKSVVYSHMLAIDIAGCN